MFGSKKLLLEQEKRIKQLEGAILRLTSALDYVGVIRQTGGFACLEYYDVRASESMSKKVEAIADYLRVNLVEVGATESSFIAKKVKKQTK